jgi:hypothetical protein
MRLFTKLLAAVPTLFPFALDCRAADATPIWRVDLRALHSERPTDQITIKFVGSYVVVYSVERPRLVFDTKAGSLLPQGSLTELLLPPWDECPRTRFREVYPAVNVIDCRKQMTIEQIGGIGPTVTEPAQFYLQEPGKEKVLIFRAKKRCQPGDPRFISDQLILLRPCNDNVVVDKAGHKVYDMPRLTYYYLTVSRDGTRFAAYERDISFFHQFEGTDRLRVKVFRSFDGEKLFDYRWHPANELTNDGRVALSDDGSRLAILRGEELLIFALPTQK